MCSNKKILQKCVDLAIKLHPKHPVKGVSKKTHYSFIVHKNKILGIGYNKPTLPITGYPDFSMLHAEYDVLTKAKINSSIKIVNIRINQDGDLRNSKPCPCCQAVMKAAGVRKVWYHTGEVWEKMEL